jgi:hypothetical protein
VRRYRHLNVRPRAPAAIAAAASFDRDQCSVGDAPVDLPIRIDCKPKFREPRSTMNAIHSTTAARDGRPPNDRCRSGEPHAPTSRRGVLVAVLASAVLAVLAGAPAAHAEDPETDRARLQQELRELLEMRRDMSEQMNEFDRRIRALESALVPESGGGTAASAADGAVASPPIVSATGAAAAPASIGSAPAVGDAPSGVGAPPALWGAYEPGRGLVLARTKDGELDWSVFTYLRYLNSQGLDETYTDAFGRTSNIKPRQDIQLQKVTINFKGWLFDPKFRYVFYAWTSNTSQGERAQVVLAGNMMYAFSDQFRLGGGIGALPSTRTTAGTFPNWLRVDNRTIADEFFRASYTTGVWAEGTVVPGVKYRAMVGNNLSQLGINATKLDDKLNTFSAALWWMPTTGEYGPAEGFGDFENHQEIATIVGANWTRSREDAQAQPDTEGFDNTQLRLSDGTLLFRADPFGTGGIIRKATYEMLAANAGFKYRGWSLDAEAYHRRLGSFRTLGVIPVDSVTDWGMQLQGSAMILPKLLQGYVSGSKIWGDYGDPWDVAVGLNWYPMKRRELRLNMQGLFLRNSPVGNSAMPAVVGGNGWVFTTDAVLGF